LENAFLFCFSLLKKTKKNEKMKVLGKGVFMSPAKGGVVLRVERGERDVEIEGRERA
jgi:hypothetical protein